MIRLFDDTEIDNLLRKQSAAPVTQPKKALPQRQTARIVHFNKRRCFAFAARGEDSADDIFLSPKALRAANIDELVKGDLVEFIAQPSRRPGGKVEGIEITLLDEAA